MVFGNIQFLLECWTEDLDVFLAISQRPSSVLCHIYFPNMAACFLKANKGESPSTRQASQSYVTWSGSDIPTPLPYFIGSESRRPFPRPRGGIYRRVWIWGDRIRGATLASVYHTTLAGGWETAGCMSPLRGHIVGVGFWRRLRAPKLFSNSRT